MDSSFYKGQKVLSDYIAKSKSPTFRGFLIQNKDSFKKWHEDSMDTDDFLQVWSNRFCEMFRIIKAKKIKLPEKNSNLKEMCADICGELQLHRERNKLKRHMEHEIVQTQAVMTTRLNKRLREEVEEDALNENEKSQSTQSSQESQSSQSTYIPESDSSDDNNADLEPMWVIDGNNLSRMLIGFRLLCYKKNLFGEALTVTERMAMNHVYMMNQTNDCFSYCSDLNNMKSKVVESFEINKYYKKASNEEITFVNNIAYSKANGAEMEAKKLAIGQLSNVELEMYATAMFTLITNYDNSFDLATIDESVFIDLALNPFIKAVLPISHKLQRSGHFTSLEGEAGLKPDMKFYTTIDRIRFDCLLIEVKCPNSACEDDLFKLSIEMQYILNRFVEHGANKPVVFGVLVYGFKCSIYKMTLVAPKVYVMMKIRTCFLPRCSEDLHVAINTLSSFSQLRDLVCEQVQSITANKRRISGIIDWICKPIIDIKE